MKPDSLKFGDGRKGLFDPHAHIVDMDLDGSKLLADAQFLGDAQVHRLIDPKRVAGGQ